jgi:hypothetical protein
MDTSPRVRCLDGSYVALEGWATLKIHNKAMKPSKKGKHATEGAYNEKLTLETVKD